MKEELTLACIGLGGLLIEPGNVIAEGADLGLEGGGVLAFAAKRADLFGHAFAVGVDFLQLGFERPAEGVGIENRVDEGRGIAAAGGEAFFDEIGFFSNETDIEHGGKAKEQRGKGNYEVRIIKCEKEGAGAFVSARGADGL